MRYRRRTRHVTVGLAVAVLAGAAGVWLAVGAPSASAGTTFTAKVALNGRDGPSLDANLVKADMYRAGGAVDVVCQDRGGMAYGSAIWDKTGQDGGVPG